MEVRDRLGGRGTRTTASGRGANTCTVQSFFQRSDGNHHNICSVKIRRRLIDQLKHIDEVFGRQCTLSNGVWAKSEEIGEFGKFGVFGEQEFKNVAIDFIIPLVPKKNWGSDRKLPVIPRDGETYETGMENKNDKNHCWSGTNGSPYQSYYSRRCYVAGAENSHNWAEIRAVRGIIKLTLNVVIRYSFQMNGVVTKLGIVGDVRCVTPAVLPPSLANTVKAVIRK